MQGMPRDNLLVIHSAHHTVMTEPAWSKLWRSYMRVLNEKYGTRTPADLERMKSCKLGPKRLDMTIPPITLHWLRHTFCTLLYLAGVDVVQACAQMGHADVVHNAEDLHPSGRHPQKEIRGQAGPLSFRE